MTDTERPKNEVPMKVQQQSAAGLDDEFLVCRMMRHNWEPYTPSQDQISVIAWGTPLGWSCTRCGMQRIDVIDARGELSWRKYNRPDGYGLPAGATPRVRALRGEFLKRMTKNRKGQS